MKKIALFSLFFFCVIRGFSASHRENIEQICHQTIEMLDAQHVKSLESINLYEELAKASREMLSGQSLLLNFYPKGCGFDTLTGQTFFEIGEVEQIASELSLRVQYSFPQRYLAQFEDREELRDFVNHQFEKEITLENYPLVFPTKIVTVKLIKE